jgi:PPM family protein phosphatase
LRMVSRTDVGRIRVVNEDRAYVKQMSNGYALAILADGMGGHQAGDVAAQMTIDIIGQQMQMISQSATIDERKKHLLSAVLSANEQIYQFSSEREQYKGMGTTVITALASTSEMIIAHIGDSRAYKLSKDSLIQLTEDHSLVNELVKTGQITPEEASHHPRRNVVIRALGTDPDVEIDLIEVVLEPNDLFILCSDGLSNLVESELMAQIIQQSPDLETAAEQLVIQALQAGGDDNITVVLMLQPEAVAQERGDNE